MIENDEEREKEVCWQGRCAGWEVGGGVEEKKIMGIRGEKETEQE